MPRGNALLTVSLKPSRCTPPILWVCVLCGWASLLASTARPASAGEQSATVLVVYSNSRLLPANVEIDGALLETIAGSTKRALRVVEEFLDVPEGDASAALSAYLHEKYAARPPSG